MRTIVSRVDGERGDLPLDLGLWNGCNLVDSSAQLTRRWCFMTISKANRPNPTPPGTPGPLGPMPGPLGPGPQPSDTRSPGR